MSLQSSARCPSPSGLRQSGYLDGWPNKAQWPNVSPPARSAVAGIALGTQAHRSPRGLPAGQLLLLPPLSIQNPNQTLAGGGVYALRRAQSQARALGVGS